MPMDLLEKPDIQIRRKHWTEKHIDMYYEKPMNRLCSTSSRITFEDRKFGDLTLEVNGEKLYAQRLVISSISPVFEAMFRHSFKESLNGNVDLSSSFSSVRQLHEFISFIYGEPLHLDPDNVIELLDASEKYFLGDLKELCSQYLFKHLRPSNCLEIWLTASFYSLKRLEIVCRHLFSSVFSFVKIQKSVIISLPCWFIELLGNNLSETHPNLFSALLTVWLSGNSDQCKSIVSDTVAASNLLAKRTLTSLKNLGVTPTKDVMSLFLHRLILPDQNALFKSSCCENQHPCIMLMNRNNLAAFYCMETKEWRTLNVPVYNGIVLGIIHGNMLVRVVPKGSSANLWNLKTGKSTQTRCVLATLAECNMNIAFLPVQSNFFLALGCLHVALIVRKFRSFQLIILRYEHLSNRWCFRVSFPLFHYLSQVVIRVFSTRRCLAYLTISEQTRSRKSTSVSAKLSYVFVIDMLGRRVIGSSCSLLGDGVMKNDCFISGNTLHFVNNVYTLVEKDKLKIEHVINRNKKRIQISAPRLELPSIKAIGRENCVGSKILNAINENILCSYYHMEPYLSAMFIFDIEFYKWTRIPPAPPIFKESPSQLMLIYTSEPVSRLLPENNPDVISEDLDIFQEWELR